MAIVRSSRRASPGSAQASARITTGASRPLAPCTVITRTASSGADGSRDLDVAAREPVEEAVERGRSRRSNSSGGEQLVDRVARCGAEPLQQLAAALHRPRQDRLEEARAAWT
jgi:hypothetical protein